MTRNRWKLLSGIALLIFSIQGAQAGEAWLVITSDPPGAAISIDDTYRGVTPQHLGDALRVKVVEGVREIQVRQRVDGKEYVAQKNVEVVGNKEILVQFNLREQPDLPATAKTPHFYWGSTGIRPVFPPGKMEVPGKNF